MALAVPLWLHLSASLLPSEPASRQRPLIVLAYPLTLTFVVMEAYTPWVFAGATTQPPMHNSAQRPAPFSPSSGSLWSSSPPLPYITSIGNGDTNEVLRTLRTGRKAHVAADGRTNRVYVASRHSSTLSVIDGHTNGLIATLDVGPDPYGLVVSDETNRIYVVNHGGQSMSVIDGRSNEVLHHLEVGASPMF